MERWKSQVLWQEGKIRLAYVGYSSMRSVMVVMRRPSKTFKWIDSISKSSSGSTVGPVKPVVITWYQESLE